MTIQENLWESRYFGQNCENKYENHYTFAKNIQKPTICKILLLYVITFYPPPSLSHMHACISQPCNILQPKFSKSHQFQIWEGAYNNLKICIVFLKRMHYYMRYQLSQKFRFLFPDKKVQIKIIFLKNHIDAKIKMVILIHFT